MSYIKYLTGIKPTGTLHLGNYISTIKPLLDIPWRKVVILIADYHSMTTGTVIEEEKYDMFRVFHSFGFPHIVFQSDIPEIMELNWMLMCYTAKGLLNRAHGYKVKKDENIENRRDPDYQINAGLYTYPVLMTSDLVIFGTKNVIIGKDQVQHIEIAKETISRFNIKLNGDVLKVPEPIIKDVMIEGFDGRKMSKSYGNTISLFSTEKDLKKNIFKIKTNSKNIKEPKYFEESPVCSLFSQFSTEKENEKMKKDMLSGVSWGEVKERTFKKINDEIKPYRDSYIKDTTNIKALSKMNVDNVKKITQIQERVKHIKNILFGRL